MDLEQLYAKHVSGNKLEAGLVAGLALGLLIGFAIKPTVITNNNKEVIDKQVIDKRPGKITVDEICASVYNAEYGHGQGLAQVSCFKNGEWYDLGARDLNQALNSSYSLEDAKQKGGEE